MMGVVEGDEMVADLVWQHTLVHRIHCMWYGDLTHDGLSELAIVSTGGIHILQVSYLLLQLLTLHSYIYHNCFVEFPLCIAQHGAGQKSGGGEINKVTGARRERKIRT